jgi:pimeloyl-ACP methyl ester carboxylesterase
MTIPDPPAPPRFVLVHSPSVTPATWAPVAEQLRDCGYQVDVPDLLGLAGGGPPYWPRVVAAATAALTAADRDDKLILVAHSNAGVFVPQLCRELPQQVICSVFADSGVPPVSGEQPMAPPAFLSFLRGLAGPDGRLPPWSQWWDEPEAAQLFPSGEVRAAVTAGEPRLPLDYYTERVLVPAGWDDHRCAYLLFSDGYQDEAAAARQRGWPVVHLPGHHLHQLVAPGQVAGALLDLALPGRP